jgi:hypothetical protein
MTSDKPAAVGREARHRYLRNCWYVAAWDHEVRDRTAPPKPRRSRARDG